jgi:spore germination protein D
MRDGPVWRAIVISGGVFVSIILISGCGMEASQASGPSSYKETKTMVLDILKSEDGRKAITEGQTFKSNSIMQGADATVIRTAVKDVMTDPRYPDMLKKIMTDPKFAADYAKAIEKENKALFKTMLKDPEYQSLLLGVMKDKEYEQLLLEVLRGKTYRKEAMKIFEEALSVPQFKMELVKLMMKAKTDQ